MRPIGEKKMKILIYFVLIIAFLMFYRQNPTFSIIILVVFLASYFYYKRRKGRGFASRGTFFSGRAIQRDGHVEDLVTLTILQQMLNNPTSVKAGDHKPRQTKEDQRAKDIEKTRKEIIALLED